MMTKPARHGNIFHILGPHPPRWRRSGLRYQICREEVAMTHDGIIIGAGYNAARVVLDDLGIEADRRHPPITSRLAAL